MSRAYKLVVRVIQIVCDSYKSDIRYVSLCGRNVCGLMRKLGLIYLYRLRIVYKTEVLHPILKPVN